MNALVERLRKGKNVKGLRMMYPKHDGCLFPVEVVRLDNEGRRCGIKPLVKPVGGVGTCFVDADALVDDTPDCRDRYLRHHQAQEFIRLNKGHSVLSKRQVCTKHLAELTKEQQKRIAEKFPTPVARLSEYDLNNLFSAIVREKFDLDSIDTD